MGINCLVCEGCGVSNAESVRALVYMECDQYICCCRLTVAIAWQIWVVLLCMKYELCSLLGVLRID